jgi:hypothetical protein
MLLGDGAATPFASGTTMPSIDRGLRVWVPLSIALLLFLLVTIQRMRESLLR